MGRKKGINQIPLLVKLDKKIYETLEIYRKDFKIPRNRAINNLLQYMLERYQSNIINKSMFE